MHTECLHGHTEVPLALSLSWMNSSMRSLTLGLLLPASLDMGLIFGVSSSLLAETTGTERHISILQGPPKKGPNTDDLAERQVLTDSLFLVVSDSLYST